MINLLFPLLASDVTKATSDEDLVKQYLESQNVAYFNLLYKRYSSKVYGKCISLLKDYDLAQDATQEVFVKILLNMSKFSGKSKFSTWIYSITYNFCIDQIRRNKKDKSVLVEDMSTAHDVMEEVDDKMLLETNVRNLKVVLEEIPFSDKAILLMKYQDSMSIKEISEVISKSESAVKMKIKRAKQKFKRVHDDLFANAEQNT